MGWGKGAVCGPPVRDRRRTRPPEVATGGWPARRCPPTRRPPAATCAACRRRATAPAPVLAAGRECASKRASCYQPRSSPRVRPQKRDPLRGRVHRSVRRTAGYSSMAAPVLTATARGRRFQTCSPQSMSNPCNCRARDQGRVVERRRRRAGHDRKYQVGPVEPTSLAADDVNEQREEQRVHAQRGWADSRSTSRPPAKPQYSARASLLTVASVVAAIKTRAGRIPAMANEGKTEVCNRARTAMSSAAPKSAEPYGPATPGLGNAGGDHVDPGVRSRTTCTTSRRSARTNGSNRGFAEHVLGRREYGDHTSYGDPAGKSTAEARGHHQDRRWPAERQARCVSGAALRCHRPRRCRRPRPRRPGRLR